MFWQGPAGCGSMHPHGQSATIPGHVTPIRTNQTNWSRRCAAAPPFRPRTSAVGLPGLTSACTRCPLMPPHAPVCLLGGTGERLIMPSRPARLPVPPLRMHTPSPSQPIACAGCPVAPRSSLASSAAALRGVGRWAWGPRPPQHPLISHIH